MCTRCEDAEGSDLEDEVTCMDRLHGCPECGAEASVTIGPAGPNPESGDVMDCDACGWESEPF